MQHSYLESLFRPTKNISFYLLANRGGTERTLLWAKGTHKSLKTQSVTPPYLTEGHLVAFYHTTHSLKSDMFLAFVP